MWESAKALLRDVGWVLLIGCFSQLVLAGLYEVIKGWIWLLYYAMAAATHPILACILIIAVTAFLIGILLELIEEIS